jgi:hypothetical protein
MGEPSKWKQHTRTWWTRECGVFQLWAGDGGMWEISTGGEMVTRGRAADLATTDIATASAAAKVAAEEALRKLLAEAGEALGPDPRWGDLSNCSRCGGFRGHGHDEMCAGEEGRAP